jgi:hypothetical protein
MKNALMAVGLTAVLSFGWTNKVSANAAEKAPGKAPQKTQEQGQVLNLKEFSFTFPVNFGPNVHTTTQLDTDGEGKLPKEHYMVTNKNGESLEVTFTGYPDQFKAAYNVANMARDDLLIRMIGGITKENCVDLGSDEGLNLYFTVRKANNTIYGRAYFLAKMPRYRYEVIFLSSDPKRLDAPEINKAFESFKAKNF